MIASIRGEVLSRGQGWIVVAVGGIGLRVEVPDRGAVAHRGDSVALHTHLVVREDSLTLFGFLSTEELEVFGLLLGVSGVGPKSALGVLSELTPAEIALAVAQEDDKPFRRAPGIGPKTAKLITVQLIGKLDPAMFSQVHEDSVASSPDDRDVLAAVVQGLAGLGYPQQIAEDAVNDARRAGADSDEAGLLRAALVLLQPTKRGKAAQGGAESRR